MRMPAELPMRLRMSLTLELEIQASAARANRAAAADLARCSRSVSMRGLGRVASMRSRIIRSSAATGGGEAVGRVHLDRLPVLDQRRIELILLLELPRAADVFERRALHRTLERDLVFGAVRFSWTASEVRDRSVPVTESRRLLALAKRPAGRIRSGDRGREHEHEHQPLFRHTHSYFTHSCPPASVVRPRPSRCSMITDSLPIFTSR